MRHYWCNLSDGISWIQFAMLYFIPDFPKYFKKILDKQNATCPSFKMACVSRLQKWWWWSSSPAKKKKIEQLAQSPSIFTSKLSQGLPGAKLRPPSQLCSREAFCLVTLGQALHPLPKIGQFICLEERKHEPFNGCILTLPFKRVYEP